MLNTDVAWVTRGVCTGRGSRAPPRDALTARYIVTALSGGPWPYTETQYHAPLETRMHTYRHTDARACVGVKVPPPAPPDTNKEPPGARIFLLKGKEGAGYDEPTPTPPTPPPPLPPPHSNTLPRHPMPPRRERIGRAPPKANNQIPRPCATPPPPPANWALPGIIVVPPPPAPNAVWLLLVSPCLFPGRALAAGGAPPAE